MNYKKLNNITGWIVFAIATFVYLSTMEQTTSLWDCGEYITTANKLEVGHPPGAPFFMMLGRLFDMKTIKIRNRRKWRRNQISFVIFPGGARYRRNPRGVAELARGWRGGRYIHVYNLPLHLRVSPLVRACNASPLRGNCGIVLVITEASPWFV